MVERRYTMNKVENIFAAFETAIRAGRLVALATIIDTSTEPNSASNGIALGGKLLIYADGTTAGSLGDIALDETVTAAARQQLVEQKSARIRIPIESHEQSTNTDMDADQIQTGLDIFIDVYAPPLKLVIVGAVHIAIPLVVFANELGFETIVVDARAAFATPERFPHADRLIVQWPADALDDIELDEATYMVVLTHDAKIDNPAILNALSSSVRYIGALGSRKTHAKRVAALKELGASDAQLSRIYGPIGLNLGGRRPEEIAVSIISEIIGVKNNSSLTTRG